MHKESDFYLFISHIVLCLPSSTCNLNISLSAFRYAALYCLFSFSFSFSCNFNLRWQQIRGKKNVMHRQYKCCALLIATLLHSLCDQNCHFIYLFLVYVLLCISLIHSFNLLGVLALNVFVMRVFFSSFKLNIFHFNNVEYTLLKQLTHFFLSIIVMIIIIIFLSR